jgi:putative GTP pyrophosphokinase
VYSHSTVNKAGDILKDPTSPSDGQRWAADVLSNWRAVHNHPIDTFRKTLSYRIRFVDRNALVAQRLKRIPSIVDKLRRYPTMKLSRMQDIGGLRAVVGNMDDVRTLYDDYRRNVRFQHELIDVKDYISTPKASGYRSLHLVYRYSCRATPEYRGLLLEMQIRTRQQHAWATAVETMGTFLQHSLKSSEGPDKWLKFFSLSGSAFARLEGTPPVPGYEGMSDDETFREVLRQARDLRVEGKLRSYRLATRMIHRNKQTGSYYLLVLDPIAKSLDLQAFAKSRFAEATAKYLEAEEKAMEGGQEQVVLVATARVESLRKAYPNFFLDTSRFLHILRKIEHAVGAS